MTAEVVGPLPTVTFRGDTKWNDPNPPKVAYAPPVNTCDPRYAACTEHHVACDCREAEFAENMQEYRYERRAVEEAAARILAGHPTVVEYGDNGEKIGCECTGCQIARAAHLPWYRWAK